MNNITKIFPIKVERVPQLQHKLIEWKIHNVCNYNCSFCDINHKNGSVRWLNIEKYKAHTDKLATLCKDSPYWIQITGGEPTLYPNLIELLTYIKSKNAYLSMLSNGSRTMRYWDELKNAKLMDYLFLTYHSEQSSDYKHIADIANLFHNEQTEILIMITHTIDTIDKALEAQQYFKENTGSIISLKAMVIGDYEIYDLYSPEQLSKLKKLSWAYGDKRSTKVKTSFPDEYRINHAIKVTYNNGLSYVTETQKLMKNRNNNFYNWECEIGKISLRIDSEIIHRGVCGVGETQNLNDDVSFFEDPIICDKPECVCGSDIIAKKTRPIDMQ